MPSESNPTWNKKIEAEFIHSGPSASGGSAKCTQLNFYLLDTKNERIILYLCITAIILTFIVNK